MHARCHGLASQERCAAVESAAWCVLAGLDLALLPHNGHEARWDREDGMGERWHPGVGANESRPEGVVSGLGAAREDGGCLEKATWDALPTRVAELPALSSVPEKPRRL